MSNVATAGMIVALATAGLFFYYFLDRWVQDRVAVILTGVLHGVSISTKDRWMLLHTSWLGGMGGGIGFYLIFAVMFLVLGRQIDTEEVRLLAYLMTFFTLVGTAAWVYQGVHWLFRLMSVLRQAEAD